MAERERPKEIHWRTFAAKHMPPLQENVLIWRGLGDSDGGFPLIGKRYERDGESVMVYKYGSTSTEPGWIEEDEFHKCRWSFLPRPDIAERKRQREAAKHG